MQSGTEAVFFDLDGTLVDTARDFHTVLNATLAAAGREPLHFARVREQVSNGARAMIRLGFGLEPGDEGFDYWLEQFLDRYAEQLTVHSTLFPGMAEVLDALDTLGVPWGVVTNKPFRFSEPLMAGLGLAHRMGPLICPDHVARRKPDPEGLLLAARQAGVNPARCIYVGDHDRDIAAGRQAGMTTVAVLFGYIEADDDPYAWRADHYIERAEQLLPLVRTGAPAGSPSSTAEQQP